MDVQELEALEKVSTPWVKVLNKNLKKINNTLSSMIGKKLKDTIKLDIVPLDKKYPEKTILHKDGLYRYLYQPGEQHGHKKKTSNIPCLG